MRRVVCMQGKHTAGSLVRTESLRRTRLPRVFATHLVIWPLRSQLECVTRTVMSAASVSRSWRIWKPSSSMNMRLVETSRWDVDELKDIQQRGTHEDYRLDYFNEMKRKEASAASEAQLHDLLREVRAIVKRPLNQTNMDILRRVVDRQEYLMQLRARKANEDYPQIVYP
ncbi:hypothetical protein C4B63_218g32 [Trypanosoma cruzi]|uniref:Uncharacterized protein n=1 Tax=Trypanosoma cruzi TaxID=5693 RepID=A0A2V2UKH3_TRYCR|nr:hypothetical protein C4B63_218g32 [Trypanosoma cruzi]